MKEDDNMYTLAEIKKIRRQYMLRDGQIEPTGKEKVKSLSEMTKEEKSYIGSALFLFRRLKFDKEEIFQELSDEEFLEQIQEQFISEALNVNQYSMSTMNVITKPAQVIWRKILSQEPYAMTYFNRVLGENRKKLQNLEWENPVKGFLVTIKYDLIDDSKNKFHQTLNPNNPIYKSESELESEPESEPKLKPTRLEDDEKDTHDKKSGRLTIEQIEKILQDEDDEKIQMEKILKGIDDAEKLEI